MVYCCLLMLQLTSYSAPGVPTYKVVGDEESLPFPSDTFDLAVSSLRYTQLTTLGFDFTFAMLPFAMVIVRLCNVEMMVVYPACDEFYQTSLLVITLANLHVGDASNFLSCICDASNKGWDEGLSLWPGLLYMTILNTAR